MSDDILSLIDNAIEDYGMSDDAMRWTPEPPAARQPPTVADFQVVIESTVRRMAEVTGVPMHMLAPTDPPPRSGFEPSYSIVDETHVWISEEAWRAAMAVGPAESVEHRLWLNGVVTDQDRPPGA